MSSRPQAVRPIFATEDFGLLHEAVSHYLTQAAIQNGPQQRKYANLSHRLESMVATMPQGNSSQARKIASLCE